MTVDRTEGEPVGYTVTISQRSRYDGMSISRDWSVHVYRHSDQEQIMRAFAWRWRARRFGRSVRRISNAFRRDLSYRAKLRERYIIGWNDRNEQTMTHEAFPDA